VTDLPEPDYGDVWDAYHRHDESEYAEHLHAKEQAVTEHRTDWKPARREPRTVAGSLALRAARKEWRLAIIDRDQGCLVHRNPAECGEDARGLLMVAHHVVYQQELRRSRPALLWNPLSGMLVCGIAHTQHHNRSRPILLDEIPPAVAAFLREAGYSYYLERHYGIPWP